MFRKALALSLFVSLVLSGIFFSPAYKAEEEDFYEDQPYLHYELRIHELDSKNTNCNTDSFMGNVYLQKNLTENLNRDNSFGVASYHFEDENNVYINWENIEGYMENGEHLPNQKQFTETYFDYENRTFLGVLNFSEPEKTTLFGINRAEYTMIFNEDHTSIIDGVLDLYDSNGTFMDTSSYGLTEADGLVYQCDIDDFSGSVYMRREYSSEESKNFRELLIKSYKISLLDEEYIQNINSILTSVEEGTMDAEKGIDDISNLTAAYDGKAKTFLDYEITTSEIVTLDMITWVRENFVMESTVDEIPRGVISMRIENINETLDSEGDIAEKINDIEYEITKEHYHRETTINGGPLLEINGIQAVWSNWEFESVGPTSHLLGGVSSQNDNRLWIGQWMHIEFPNAIHTSGNHTLKFEWADEDFKGKETSFHVGLGYGEVFTNITTNTNDVYRDDFESDWFSFYSDNNTVGSFIANFGPGYPDFETYSWQEAVDYASTLTYNGVNGHLATITTQEEADLIYSLLDGSSYWLGGFHNMSNPDYLEPSNGWEWITGEPFSQEFWGDGEPNEAGPEDCLEVWGFDKFLNDNRCHIGWMGLVVEYEMANGSNHYEAYVPMWNWDMENETDVFSMVMAMPLSDEERNEILKEQGDPDADDDGIVDIFDEDDDNDGIDDENDMDDDNDGIDDENDRCSGTKSGEAVDEDGCSASQIIGELSDEEGGLPGFSFIVSIIAVLGLAILRKPRL